MYALVREGILSYHRGNFYHIKFDRLLQVFFSAFSQGSDIDIFGPSPGVYPGIVNQLVDWSGRFMYDRKSDLETKVIPKPNYVCKTAKLIPNWGKTDPDLKIRN